MSPSYVPETMKAMDLLRNFLSHPQGMAIVVDEFGGTEGIITLSDIVEEIMSDAAPLGDADLYIEPLDDCRFLVSGNARLDDLSEHLGVMLAGVSEKPFHVDHDESGRPTHFVSPLNRRGIDGSRPPGAMLE